MRQGWIAAAVITTLVVSDAHTVAAQDADAGRVEVAGTQLCYEVQGEGRTVILLHGGLLSSRMWDGQIELLAADHRVVRYDARGHGCSGPIEGEHCHYCDLKALMTALGIDRAVLVGLSLGARTAIDFTLEHPDMVEALVAVAPGISGWEFTDPVLKERWKRQREAADKGDEAGYVEWFQRSWTDGPRRTPAEVDSAVRERVREMAAATVAKPGTMGPTVEAGAVGRLSEIEVPTLVIVGELDMSDIHRIAQALADQIQGARLVTVPGVAHMVNLEAPEAFNASLIEFLRALE